MDLYTNNGIPLQVWGDKVYSRSGVIVGRIKGPKVYGTNGQYVGSIVGDQLVYRLAHSFGVSGSFGAKSRSPTGRASRPASGLKGNEPNIPD